MGLAGLPGDPVVSAAARPRQGADLPPARARGRRARPRLHRKAEGEQALTSAEGAPRLLLGNLDAEEDFSLLTRSPRGGRPLRRHPWTRAALASAAGAATLLRAFARPGDRLWTPAPVAAGRLAAVPGLPQTPLEGRPPSRLGAAGRLLARCRRPAARGARPSVAARVAPPAR